MGIMAFRFSNNFRNIRKRLDKNKKLLIFELLRDALIAI